MPKPLNLSLKPHTVLLLVGPTHCGKSRLAEQVYNRAQESLQQALQGTYRTPNVQLISSDRLRQEILGYPAPKFSPEMRHASAAAFQLLHTKLKAALTSPVHADYVIIDSTGLDSAFRKEVISLVREHGFNIDLVLFDFKDYPDYYRFAPTAEIKAAVSKHVERLHRDVLGQLERHEYDHIYTLRAPDQAVELLPEFDLFARVYAPKDLNLPLLALGDVHGHYDALVQLLANEGVKLTDGLLPIESSVWPVFVGDMVDKGPQAPEVIRFLHRNLGRYTLVCGNHEASLAKALQSEHPQLEVEFFSTLPLLQQDAVLRQQFLEVVSSSVPFFRGTDFIVTHAPVPQRYLGKYTPSSIESQTYGLRSQEKDETARFSYLFKEASNQLPRYIFGHRAWQTSFRFRNVFGIDTGAGHGHRLTALYLGPRIRFCSVLIDAAKASLCYPTPQLPEPEVELESLPFYIQKRIRDLAYQGVQFVSGTMCPADKTDASLEDLAAGLELMSGRGNADYGLVLQPKFMGSRAQVYLYRDLAQCFLTSRQGFRIKQVTQADGTLTSPQALLAQLHQQFAAYWEECDFLLLDGELLPWFALGKNLIEQEFAPVGVGLQAELEWLKTKKFDSALQTTLDAYQASGWLQDRQLSKAALVAKYPHYNTWRALDELAILPSTALEEPLILNYQQQLALYGTPSPLQFKPFALLKARIGGKVIIPALQGNEVSFPAQNLHLTLESEIYAWLQQTFCPQPASALTLTPATRDTWLEQARAFFARLTLEEGMEGVVIKPEKRSKGAPPYLKVRNPNYLSIIYGYNYTHPQLLARQKARKSIRGKLSLSIREYDTALKVLALAPEEISANNPDYIRYINTLINDQEAETKLDPRL